MKKHPQLALDEAAIEVLPPGRHTDGNGLYLNVDPSGARRWIWRGVVRMTGRRVDLGFGSTTTTSLKRARQLAVRCRRWSRDGKDPKIEIRAVLFGRIIDREAGLHIYEDRNDLRHRAFEMTEGRIALRKLEGASNKRIVDELNAEKIFTFQGKPWTSARLDDVLLNIRGRRWGRKPQ